MSFSKLEKYIERPFEVGHLSCQPVIIGDSKACLLRRELNQSHLNVQIKFICRGGASFREQFFISAKQFAQVF